MLGAALSLLLVPIAFAQGKPAFNPGNLVVSRTVYDILPGNVTVGETLPPNCVASAGGCVTAVSDGTFPWVFNNDPVDGSFGITSRIFLDHSTPSGHVIISLEVPEQPRSRDYADQRSTRDQLSVEV